MTQPGPVPSSACPTLSTEGSPKEEGRDQDSEIRVRLDPELLDDGAVKRLAAVLFRLLDE